MNLMLRADGLNPDIDMPHLWLYKLRVSGDRDISLQMVSVAPTQSSSSFQATYTEW